MFFAHQLHFLSLVFSLVLLCSGSGLTSIGALLELFSSVGFTTSLIFSGVILTGFGGTGKPSDKKLGGIISQWDELLFFFSLYGG